MSEFNSTMVRTEYPDYTGIDLRPFGAQQNEALEFYLDAALKQGNPFDERKVVLEIDANVILPDTARDRLAELRERGVSLTVILQRD